MSARRTRRPVSRGRSRVGERMEVTVGPVAHGGHCVARTDAPEGERGRVIFVRHALPGERVLVEITEGTEGDRFWRGDAIEVLRASPDRVEAPCPVAGPGLCGGCDLQHVELGAQRRLKGEVVREQLIRIGGLGADDPLVAGLVVEAVPGDVEGLRWRTRVRYAATPDGRWGLRKHRSREVVPVEDCLLDAAGAEAGGGLDPNPALGTPEPGTRHAGTRDSAHEVHTHYGSHTFGVAADGFWQVHPGAPRVLVETALDLLGPRPGERVLDLYAGVGLFTAFLADAVTPTGSVIAVEGSPSAGEHARRNLSGKRQVRVEVGSVDRVLEHLDCPPADVVVLDPPREGAKRRVVEQVVSCAPRAVAYVACDPAALARDTAILIEHGYRLTGLRAFDLFPMTHHVECVALFEK